MAKETASLQAALDSILARLSCLESTVGVQSPSTATPSTAAVVEDEIPPSLVAYDEHISRTTTPFINACNAIEGLQEIGTQISIIWTCLRSIIEIGTKCKRPSNIQTSIMPFLKPVQDAMGKIRSARLDRKFDWHIKAIMEMLACVSWVIMSAPPAPSSFIKELVGASDFWGNKIRKEYKGKDDKQIAFCDTMKAMILDLSAYVKEFHLSGLMWNPRGVAMEDYEASATTSASSTVAAPTPPAPAAAKPSMPSSGDIMKELAAKRTSDGTSAATGLKKVSRDQQTWRKEFKAETTAPAVAATASTTVKPSAIKAAQVKKLGVPVCKFQSIGSKWVVENQTKESNPNGICVVEVKDPKEQVYIYKCENATIQIKGKVKGVVLDSCTKCNLLFESAISSCEVVNSKRVQLQSTGICPSFSIDKTDGCLIYLSQEAVSITNFVTSKSTEMNVSWFDEKADEQKEAPIPEQFVHRIVDGKISSDVSDLYH